MHLKACAKAKDGLVGLCLLHRGQGLQLAPTLFQEASMGFLHPLGCGLTQEPVQEDALCVPFPDRRPER